MGKKRYAPEEIIKHLRTFEIAQAKGETIEGFVRSIGIHPFRKCDGMKEYGGLRVNQAKKMKDLISFNNQIFTLKGALLVFVSARVAPFFHKSSYNLSYHNLFGKYDSVPFNN